MREAGVMTLNHGEGDRLTGTEMQGLDKLGVKSKKKNTRANNLHTVLNSFLYDFYMSHSTGGHCFPMCCILEKSFFLFFICLTRIANSQWIRTGLFMSCFYNHAVQSRY